VRCRAKLALRRVVAVRPAVRKQRARLHALARRAVERGGKLRLPEQIPAQTVKPVRVGSALIHVGTSGWHYKQWVGDFYPPRFPPAKMLAWYAREFHTVEINNSFYRLPEEKTFRDWASTVPPGFLFAVKASRFLTHIKRLRDAEDPIKLFFSRAKHLGPHLGPVLFQLPPKWKADSGRLREFLALLPEKHQYAIEFRDDSWYTEEIRELLIRHNVALCVHDWHAADWARELTANFTYIRFHGTSGRYAGNYPNDVLRDWAKQIQSWAARLGEVYVYFNNDVGGHAVRNARTLRTALQELAKDPDLLSEQDQAA
jgi:uncharacterized protein YecE (DUF72 family)